MRQGPHMVEPRDHSELQLEAQRMTNDVSKISVEKMVEIELKAKRARPEEVGTLEIMAQLEKCKKYAPNYGKLNCYDSIMCFVQEDPLQRALLRAKLLHL